MKTIRDRELLRLVAEGRAPRLTCLDGAGVGQSWAGLEADAEVEGDELDLLDRVLDDWRANPGMMWAGWLSYELGSDELLGRRLAAGKRRAFPGLKMRRYPQPYRVEHSAEIPPELDLWPLGSLRPQISAAEFRERVQRAKRYIADGDCYQVNLSQPFFAPWSRDAPDSMGARAAAVFARLRARTPAAMGGLVAVGDGRWIVSNSPETLLTITEAETEIELRSAPIKGTRPRYADPQRDRAAIEELRASEKDAAEHLMIVDLVRNDLGQEAIPGTVQAPSRPTLVSLPTVHHLVSEVRCRMPRPWSLEALARALFPGGSITGAPKRRSVEIIEELEGQERGIYCGSLLVLGPEGVALNIAIRTGILDETGLSLRSGGGIVADSDPEGERLETVAKARAFDA